MCKAQIHAGGRGKAGGVKLIDKEKFTNRGKKMMGQTLIHIKRDHQEKR